jgi:hypothetical protein
MDEPERPADDGTARTSLEGFSIEDAEAIDLSEAGEGESAPPGTRGRSGARGS